MKNATARKYLAISKRLTEGYDRARFGALATEESLFILVQADELIHSKLKANSKNPVVTDDEYLFDAASALNDKLTNYIRARGRNIFAVTDSYNGLLAEVMFWWSTIELTKSQQSYLDSQKASNSIRVWFNHFVTLYEHPKYEPFYQSRIFDEDAINHALRNDIDIPLLTSAIA